MTCGIYKIINKENNQFYIGSSKNIERRFCIHRSRLKRNEHHSIYLQRAYNLYGPEKFEYVIFLICSEEDLFDNEQKLLDIGDCIYNTSKKASGGDLISYHPDKENIVKKMKDSLKIRFDSLSKEERDALYGHRCESNGMFGKTHTEEVKKKLSEFHSGNKYSLGRKHSKEAINKMSKIASERIGDKNHFFGRNHSEESKKKMSESQKERNVLPSNTLEVEVDGIRYLSASKASKVIGCKTATILNRIRSDKFPSYKFVNTKCLETIPNGSSDDAKREATQEIELVI